MSKRKVRFEGSAESGDAGSSKDEERLKKTKVDEEAKEGKWNRTFKSNHTLDSDEEDDKDEKEYNLEETDIVDGRAIGLDS